MNTKSIEQEFLADILGGPVEKKKSRMILEGGLSLRFYQEASKLAQGYSKMLKLHRKELKWARKERSNKKRIEQIRRRHDRELEIIMQAKDDLRQISKKLGMSSAEATLKK